MTTTRTLMPLALDAVGRAGDLVRTARPGAITAKGDRDMASEVDYRIEREMRDLLARQTPGIGFLGEEKGRSGAADIFWTLDPIDGTANFVRGLPLCAVSLALIEEDQPILGVVTLPLLATTYTAERGHGAFEGSRRIHANRTAKLGEAIVAVGDYAVGGDADRKNRLRLAVTRQLAERVQRVRMLGTAALDLVWVADGKLDASITLSNKPWDTAAGALVAREAGALVVDSAGSPHTIRSETTVAVAAPLVDELVQLLAAVQDEAAT